MTAEHLRAAITAALEALDAGETRYACEILLSALEDGPTARRYSCEVCAVPFEWPGELEAHLDHHHRKDAAA